jgi:hypothetical protein
LAIDSIANPHLNDDPATIIAFPDETFGLRLLRFLAFVSGGYFPNIVRCLTFGSKLTQVSKALTNKLVSAHPEIRRSSQTLGS